jgi:hypothetical protein
MAKEDVVVAVYEDGEVFECSLSMWISSNSDSEEAMVAFEEMQRGEAVVMGGGAQPLCVMAIEERENSDFRIEATR